MSKEIIKDGIGRVIGYRIQESYGATYMNNRGQVVARYRDGKTYTNTGQMVGNGDQGVRLL